MTGCVQSFSINTKLGGCILQYVSRSTFDGACAAHANILNLPVLTQGGGLLRAMGGNLKTLVDSSSNPFRGWDIDFFLMQVTPTAIPCFENDWWTLGGSAKRSAPGFRADPFPDGLELANEPFTLRVQPPDGTTDAEVAAWGRNLIEIFKGAGGDWQSFLGPTCGF